MQRHRCLYVRGIWFRRLGQKVKLLGVFTFGVFEPDTRCRNPPTIKPDTRCRNPPTIKPDTRCRNPPTIKPDTRCRKAPKCKDTGDFNRKISLLYRSFTRKVPVELSTTVKVLTKGRSRKVLQGKCRLNSVQPTKCL